MKEIEFFKKFFLFLIFLVPFFLGSLDLFYPNIFLAILVVIFFLLFFLQIKNNKIKLFIPFTFLIFTLFLIINFFTTINFFETRNEFFKNLIYFLTLFLLLNLFSKNDLKTILRILFISSIFISLYGLIIYFLLENPSYLIFSTFLNPNCLANYLIMIIPISYFLLKEEKEFLGKQRIFYGVIIIFLTLILTGSRGAILSLILSLLILFILKKTILKDKFVILSLSLVFLIVLGIFITKPLLKERAMNFFNFQHRSQLFRVLVWKGTIKIIEENPYLGTGYGTFKVVYPRYKLGGSNTQMAHNTYLQIASELGLVGFFFFTYLLFSNFNKNILKGEIYYIAIFSSILSFLIHNFFDYSYYIPANGIIFWALLGVLNLKEENKFLTKEIRFGNLKKILLYFVFLMMLFVSNFYILKIGIANFYYEKGDNFGYEKKYEEAEKEYKKAVYLDPSSDKYYATLGGILAIQKKYEEAEKEYKKAIKIFKNSSYYHYELGIVYLRQGKFKKALEEFEKAIFLQPSFTSPHKELADLYLVLGEIDLAKKEYKEIAKQKNNPYNQDRYQPIPNRGENPDFAYAENKLKLIKKIKNVKRNN